MKKHTKGYFCPPVFETGRSIEWRGTAEKPEIWYRPVIKVSALPYPGPVASDETREAWYDCPAWSYCDMAGESYPAESYPLEEETEVL